MMVNVVGSDPVFILEAHAREVDRQITDLRTRRRETEAHLISIDTAISEAQAKSDALWKAAWKLGGVEVGD